MSDKWEWLVLNIQLRSSLKIDLRGSSQKLNFNFLAQDAGRVFQTKVQMTFYYHLFFGLWRLFSNNNSLKEVDVGRAVAHKSQTVLVILTV